MEDHARQNKRWSERRKICKDIKILFADQICYTRTRDIGLGGMFVGMNYFHYPRDSVVHILVRVLTREGVENHHFRAKIAHVNEQGYGLQFVNFSKRDFRILQDVLATAQDSSMMNTPDGRH